MNINVKLILVYFILAILFTILIIITVIALLTIVNRFFGWERSLGTTKISKLHKIFIVLFLSLLYGLVSAFLSYAWSFF